MMPFSRFKQISIFLLLFFVTTPVHAENKFRYRVIEKKSSYESASPQDLLQKKVPLEKSKNPKSSLSEIKPLSPLPTVQEILPLTPLEKVEKAAPRPTEKDFLISEILSSASHLKYPRFNHGFNFYDFLEEKLRKIPEENFQAQYPFVLERLVQMHQIFPIADHRIKTHYEPLIQKEALYWGVSPQIIKAIIIQESQGLNEVASHKGAKGLMQLIDATSDIFEVTDPYDPKQNIRAGILHFRWMMRVFENDLELSLAAYNAGKNRVQRFEGVPPYPETQNYVTRVQEYYDIYQRIDLNQVVSGEK